MEERTICDDCETAVYDQAGEVSDAQAAEIAASCGADMADHDCETTEDGGKCACACH